MFIILLLVAPGLCEWVEISQHHVRKPTRTYNFRPIEIATEEYTEVTTRATKIYLNQSLTERSWTRGNINKVPKLGNVQRVQLDDSPIKAPSLNVNPVRNSLNVGDTNTVHRDVIKESVSGANGNLMETKRLKIGGGAENERSKTTNKHSTSNLEKVYPKFQETTSKDEPTKTSLSYKYNRPLNELDQVGFNKLGSRNPNFDDTLGDFNILANKEKTNVSQRPQVFGLDFSNRNSVSKTEVERSNIRQNDSGKPPPSIDENKSRAKITSLENQRNKPTLNGNLKTIDAAERDDKVSTIRSKLTNYEFVTNNNKPIIDDDTDATVSDDNEDLSSTSSHKPANQVSGDENFEYEEEVDASNNKVNSIENLIGFMKVVADTIRKNTRRSVYSKTRYLTNLKNTILANIAERIDGAWPDDESTQRPRKSRAVHGSPRGHLEIPSSESALMTISFLTFAVFLIKLVLQVIQTYKNKSMMVAPAVVAVGRTLKRSFSKP